MSTFRGFALTAFAALVLAAFLVGSKTPDAGGAYAPVNGLKLYYEIHGSDSAGRPPLVLLHGGDPTIATSFGKVLPGLAKDRKAIAFEQQGHGHTADVDRPFSFDQSAEDAVALLRYLKIGKADFYGYSNGGHIALVIAMKHPEVVRKLVIQSAMFSRDGSDPAFWESFKNATLNDMPKELRDAYLATAPHPEELQSFFDKSVRRMREFKGWTADEIRSIKAPALIIAGDRDIVRPEHAVRMFRLLPNSELAILPATDHLSMVDRAGYLVPMIGNFLDEHMPEAAKEKKEGWSPAGAGPRADGQVR